MPCSLADQHSPCPVVQSVTSDILVPEVMKLIWRSVSDMANEQSPYWTWSTGGCALLCCGIVEDYEYCHRPLLKPKALGSLLSCGVHIWAWI